MGWRWVYVCGLALALFGQVVRAGKVEVTKVAGKRATVRRVDVGTERIELFLRDEAGRSFKSFEAVEGHLAKRGERLAFAMNAGMFHRDLSPVGLFVANSKKVTSLNTNSGYGNFFMKPNGVFVISEDGARVIETSEYETMKGGVILATHQDHCW